MTAGTFVSTAVSRTITRLKEDAQTRTGRAVAALFVLSALAPLFLGAYWEDVIIQMLVYVVVVASWVFIAGYFGMFTFGHAAIFGVGGYAAVIFANEAGVPIFLALLGGALAAGILSLPITIPVLKLETHYIAMVTVAYAEIIYLGTIHFRDITGGPTGYSGFDPMFGGDRTVLLYFLIGFVALVLLVMYALLVSRFGLVARAIRESEDAAQMLGNNTLRYKLGGFFIGSSIGGLAGGLQAYNILIMSPPVLDLLFMVEIAAMGIVGGFRSLSGAVFGVVLVFGLSEILRPFGELRLVVWGILLVAAVMFFPNGISGVDLFKSRN